MQLSRKGTDSGAVSGPSSYFPGSQHRATGDGNGRSGDTFRLEWIAAAARSHGALDISLVDSFRLVQAASPELSDIPSLP